MANKRVLKALMKRASTLPMVMQETRELHYVKGSELLEQGQTKVDGVVVLPDAIYPQWFPVRIAVNHFRRLKNAYNKHGLDGIRHYENSIADLMEKQTKEA